MAETTKGNSASTNHKNQNLTDKITEVKETFYEYCSCTSIHGIQYLKEPNLWLRLIWIVIVMIFLGLITWFLIPIVEKWNKNPIELAFEQKFVSIDSIHFPAITICPLQMPNKRLYDYENMLEEIDKTGFDTKDNEKLDIFKLTSHTCYSQLGKHLNKLLNVTEQYPQKMTNIEEDYAFINNYFLLSSFSLFMCKGVVNDDFWKCDTKFHRHFLDVGLCYSFNMLPKEEILRPEIIYPLAESPNYIPPNISYFNSGNKKTSKSYKVANTREELELEIHAHGEFKQEICEPDLILYIHNPDELPWERTKHFRMQNQDVGELSVAIEPEVIKADEKIHSFSPIERDCYFPDELPLKYFLKYSKANCEYECSINSTESKWNCLPEFMPRNNDTKLCNLTITMLVLNDIWSIDTGTGNSSCHCLNDCNSITYNIQLSNIHRSRKVSRKAEANQLINATDVVSDLLKFEIREKLYLLKTEPSNIPHNITEDGMKELLNGTGWDDLLNDIHFSPFTWNSSYFHIYYAKSQFLPMRRHTIYTFADFVSQCGGIFGGFMGISLLSFVEIAYFSFGRFLVRYIQEMCSNCWRKITMDSKDVNVDADQQVE